MQKSPTQYGAEPSHQPAEYVKVDVKAKVAARVPKITLFLSIFILISLLS